MKMYGKKLWNHTLISSGYMCNSHIVNVHLTLFSIKPSWIIQINEFNFRKVNSFESFLNQKISPLYQKKGNIEHVDYDDKVPAWCRSESEQLVDGTGCSLIPGLVDAHTHPIWSGDRCFEFDLKSRGELWFGFFFKWFCHRGLWIWLWIWSKV